MNIKTFEELIEPKIGDYVICEDECGYYNSMAIKLNKFLKNNIGKIIKLDVNGPGSNAVSVNYTNIPKKIEHLFHVSDNNYFRLMLKSEIIHCSPNIEDLEHILQANKYNL